MEKNSIQLGTANLKATWRTINGSYVHSRALFVGKLKVASYHYNGLRAKGDPLEYKAVSHITGFKPELGSFATKEECEKICEEVVKEFFKYIQKEII